MIDGLLKDQIRNDPEISQMLAVYKGKTAFFYQKAPDDTDQAWEGSCFPRADYSIDMRYDPERKTSGTLVVNIWCSEKSKFMPEDIEPKFIEAVSETFYTGDVTTCAIWDRSDALEYDEKNQENKGTTKIFGVRIMFSLIEFPVQETANPDPIQGLNEHVKKWFPDAWIIGMDALPPVLKSTDDKPVLYWRTAAVTGLNKSSYAVDWYEGTYAMHVFSRSITARNQWSKKTMEILQIPDCIKLSDGSPMLVKKVVERYDLDPLRDGQLTLTGTYGVLTVPYKNPPVPEIENIIIQSEGGLQMGKQTPDETKKSEQKMPVDNGSRYSIDAFAGAHLKFGVPQEIVTVALRESGKSDFSLTEAQTIIKKFAEKEVKANDFLV